jgi:pimeloyl-ACP methyl ester carboxylesterase
VPRRIPPVLRVPLLLAILYLPYCATMAVFKDTFVFPVRNQAEARGKSAPAGATVLHLEPEPGTRIEGWFFPALRAPGDTSPAPSALFFHGNGDLIDYHVALARLYTSAGWNILLCGYRGYGRSTGEPQVDKIADDATGWYDLLLRQPDVDAGRIVLHGYSLGSAFAAPAAARRPVSGLLLEAPFRSLRIMARRHMVWIYLARQELDTETIVRGFTGPVLVLHGNPDPVVPFEHGQAVAAAAGPRGRLEVFATGHAPSEDWDRYSALLTTFLDERRTATPPKAAP